MSSDAAEKALADGFRQAMRRLTASIVLVSAQEGSELYGMVATAFSSVSASPPSVVIGVNQSASVHGPVFRTRRFGISLMAPDHAELIGIFSSTARRIERFQGDGWESFDGGVPRLGGAIASWLCDVDAQLDYGTHTLFVGQVRDIHLGEADVPMLWHAGGIAAQASRTGRLVA